VSVCVLSHIPPPPHVHITGLSCSDDRGVESESESLFWGDSDSWPYLFYLDLCVILLQSISTYLISV